MNGLDDVRPADGQVVDAAERLLAAVVLDRQVLRQQRHAHRAVKDDHVVGHGVQVAAVRVRKQFHNKNASSQGRGTSITFDALIFQNASVGIGTNSRERLPRLHRADPSASLDECTMLFYQLCTRRARVSNDLTSGSVIPMADSTVTPAQAGI